MAVRRSADMRIKEKHDYIVQCLTCRAVWHHTSREDADKRCADHEDWHQKRAPVSRGERREE